MCRHNQHARAFWVISLLLASAVTILFASGCQRGGSNDTTSSSIAPTDRVGTDPLAPRPVIAVAAENFYGDVVSRIGGDMVKTTSILQDAGVDPHDYESTVGDAKLIAHASLVVANGGGYDPWIDKLLNGSPNSNRIVIHAVDYALNIIPGNPHVWYAVENVQAVANAVAAALSKLDPSHSDIYEANLATFQRQITPLRDLITKMNTKFSGLPVALTEPIFLYMSQEIGLRVLTPVDFQQAVSEGYDPPASALLTAQQQIRDRQVMALIYNSQTAGTLTTRLKEDAVAAGVPVIPITETMPAGMHYEDWMTSELHALSDALTAQQAGSSSRAE